MSLMEQVFNDFGCVEFTQLLKRPLLIYNSGCDTPRIIFRKGWHLPIHKTIRFMCSHGEFIQRVCIRFSKQCLGLLLVIQMSQ